MLFSAPGPAMNTRPHLTKTTLRQTYPVKTPRKRVKASLCCNFYAARWYKCTKGRKYMPTSYAPGKTIQGMSIVKQRGRHTKQPSTTGHFYCKGNLPICQVQKWWKMYSLCRSRTHAAQPAVPARIPQGPLFPAGQTRLGVVYFA